MPTSLLTFNLLLFLLPGFVTLKVREALTVVGKTSDLSRLVDALLFSLYNYAVYFTLARAVGLQQVTVLGVKADPSGADLQLISPNLGAIFLMIAVAVTLGVFIGVGTERDWFHKLKMKLRLTQRQARIDLWAEAFYQAKGCWVLVHLDDGRKVLGWPYLYSDEPDRRQLCLRDARVRSPDGGEYDVIGPWILVTEGAKITLVEFLSGATNRPGGSSAERNTADTGKRDQNEGK